MDYELGQKNTEFGEYMSFGAGLQHDGGINSLSQRSRENKTRIQGIAKASSINLRTASWR